MAAALNGYEGVLRLNLAREIDAFRMKYGVSPIEIRLGHEAYQEFDSQFTGDAQSRLFQGIPVRRSTIPGLQFGRLIRTRTGRLYVQRMRWEK